MKRQRICGATAVQWLGTVTAILPVTLRLEALQAGPLATSAPQRRRQAAERQREGQRNL
jgi:hypothetical protein